MSQTQDTKARDEGIRRLQIEENALAKMRAQELVLVKLQTELQAQLVKARSEVAASLAAVTEDQLVKLAQQRAKADYEVKALEDSLQEVTRRHKELQDGIDAQTRNVEFAEIAVKNAEVRLQINEVLLQLERLLSPIKGLLDTCRDLKRPENHALWILGRLEVVKGSIEKSLEVAADKSLDV